MPTEIRWHGEELKRRVVRAASSGIDATMAAAILHAKANHGENAHGQRRFRSGPSANLERSIQIVQPAKRDFRGVGGRWGSRGLVYARRIELGFQGQDKLGRVVNAPAYPFLRPAAEAEYPKLADRIRRALRRA